MTLKTQLRWVFYVALLLTLIEIVNLITARSLTSFGIFPRQVHSLPYILSAPLIHGSVMHYLSNLISLCSLSLLLLQYGKRRYLEVSALAIIVTGALVWLFARSAYHVGASGVIYAYFGYLLLAGLLQRQLKLFIISVLIILFYGGMIVGVLPQNGYISWESHLFGFITGLLLAYRHRKPT